MKLVLRPALPPDAGALSRLIGAVLQRSNTADYSPDDIARLVAAFPPEATAGMITARQVFVIAAEDQLIGTVALDGAVLRSLFIDPDHQHSGLGRQLVRHVEDLARAEGITRLQVPSSVTAEGFYAKLGYRSERVVMHGSERTIVMSRDLN